MTNPHPRNTLDWMEWDMCASHAGMTTTQLRSQISQLGTLAAGGMDRAARIQAHAITVLSMRKQAKDMAA